MPLSALLALNLVWALLMGLAFLLLAVFGFTPVRAIIVLLLIGYIYLASRARKRERWAVGVSIVVAVALAARWLPMVVLNLVMFAAADPLYTDSPGTIVIVFIYALLFAFPATLMSIGYLLHWREVFAILSRSSGVAGGA